MIPYDLSALKLSLKYLNYLYKPLCKSTILFKDEKWKKAKNVKTFITLINWHEEFGVQLVQRYVGPGFRALRLKLNVYLEITKTLYD